MAAGTVVGTTDAWAAGTATVTPNADLVDGQAVTINGSGWVPGHQLRYCESLMFPFDGCTFLPTTADSSGNFSVQLNVERYVFSSTQGRELDCAEPAVVCAFTVFDNSNVFGTVTTVYLNFAGPPKVPAVVPGAASIVEGSAGTRDVHVPVTLQFPTTQTVTVEWATLFVPGAPGIQADPATDYTPASGTVTFAPGETAKAVPISVRGDLLVEPDEYVVALFSNPTNGKLGGYYGLGGSTITNDDHAVVVPGGASVVEGTSGAVDVHIPVTLTNPSTQTVTASWTTRFVPGAPGNQADPGTDYAPASGNVTFAPGETAQSVVVSVVGDTDVEPDEYLVVTFSNATNATLGGYYGLGAGVIQNDD